jgi:hypothetical protein
VPVTICRGGVPRVPIEPSAIAKWDSSRAITGRWRTGTPAGTMPGSGAEVAADWLYRNVWAVLSVRWSSSQLPSLKSTSDGAESQTVDSGSLATPLVWLW